MSEALYHAEAQLNYRPDPALPVELIAVAYGDEVGTPDPFPTVEVTWSHTSRPAVLTTTVGWSQDWQGRMDAALRLAVWRVETVFASLGGWPEPTPLPDLPGVTGGAFVPE